MITPLEWATALTASALTGALFVLVDWGHRLAVWTWHRIQGGWKVYG